MRTPLGFCCQHPRPSFSSLLVVNPLPLLRVDETLQTESIPSAKRPRMMMNRQRRRGGGSATASRRPRVLGTGCDRGAAADVSGRRPSRGRIPGSFGAAVLLVFFFVVVAAHVRLRDGAAHAFSEGHTSYSTTRRRADGTRASFFSSPDGPCRRACRRGDSSSRLMYRPLDERDDEGDPSYVRVQSKAPSFGLYGVKEAVRRPFDDDATGATEQGQGGTNTFRRPPSQRQPASYSSSPSPLGQRPPSSPPPKSALNVALIRALTLNQVLILALGAIAFVARLVVVDGFQALGHLDEALNWAGTSAPAASSFVGQVLWGVGGALPLLVINNRIENSDQRAFANVNFSTIVMVMTLFGRRRPPPEEFLPPSYGSVQAFPTTSPAEAAVQSLLMSIVTGLCEETVFRQFVPSVIAATTGHPSWALAGQAILFGLGHSNPKSPTSENAIVVGLQAVNGLGFGLIYLLSGGDVVPCVVAHALYDFVAFFATWTTANDQLEYAERMYREPLSADQERQVQELLRGGGAPRLDPKLYRAIKRLFYTFDFDKNKTLSLSEVRKGVAYMALERAGTPPPQRQVDQLFLAAVQSRRLSRGDEDSSNRLSFADFLRLYLSMLSRAANQPTAAA